MHHLKITQKVYCYIVWQDKLLIFRHVDFPEAGLQVPGGTVEPDEPVEQAACREAFEETGLETLEMVTKLGVYLQDMAAFGLSWLHQRHFFYLRPRCEPPEEWRHWEATPSDGSPAPIALAFYWVPLANVPALAGAQDQMLPRLRSYLDKSNHQ